MMILLDAANEFHFWSSTAIYINFAVLLLIVAIQVSIFIDTLKRLKGVKGFFNIVREYSTYESVRTVTDDKTGEDKQEPIKYISNVAIAGSALAKLINEINAYIKETKGTTEFSVIKDKTQRAIDIQFDMANSKLSYPTHIGLMGTFVGILAGLISFLVNYNPDSLDASIQTLIGGVIVSMATSFVGLILTTFGNWYSSKTQADLETDQSEFYEFIQNKLMPSLDVSLVKAIEKLHITVNQFEPAFSGIIDKFEKTFNKLADAFGDKFANSVDAVTKAVNIMGQHMDKINENIEGQKELIETLKSKEVIKSLERFINASNHFEQVAQNLEEFKERTNDISRLTQEVLGSQRRYKESMDNAVLAVNKMDALLDRVKKFEESVNNLGTNIAEIDILDKENINNLYAQIRSIKSKQQIIDHYHEITDKQLSRTLSNEDQEFAKLAKEYGKFIRECMNSLKTSAEEAKREMNQRKQEYMDELKERFSIEGVDKEFIKLAKLEKLDKLDDIESKLDKLQAIADNTSQTKQSVDSVKASVDKVKSAVDNKKVEVTVKRQGLFG